LGSLGTFHQLWVGADEWKEHGPSILAQSESNVTENEIAKYFANMLDRYCQDVNRCRCTIYWIFTVRCIPN
jgi:hypothetical protein